MLDYVTINEAAVQRGPFSVADAARAGLRWHNLQTRAWTRRSRGQYSSSALASDPNVILRAVAQRLPREHAFSGFTAAWLLGLDVSPCEPVELTIGRVVPIRARAGVKLRRAKLPDSDVITRRGLRITCPMRTVGDIGSRANLVDSVVALDMALHAGLVGTSELARYVQAHAGEKGIKRLRSAMRLADARTESPMETRLRLELIKARLPLPCVQADLHDAKGHFIGRADLYYPDRRLVIEYDGEKHRDRLVSDVRRQNALLNAGYRVLRFTATDLRTPALIAAQVRGARHMGRALAG